MELETALNLLRFTGLWPLKEKISLRSKLIRIRAAVSQLVYVILMSLIIVKLWTRDSSTNADYYLDVAKNAFLIVKEYSSVMFFYRKKKQIQQLISSCTGEM
jgi:hypothetical protein